MDNFIIGSITEHVKVLQSDIQAITSNIPTKITDLSDLSGKWNVNEQGDILPETNGVVSLGTIEKALKSIYVSEIHLPPNSVKPNNEDVLTYYASPTTPGNIKWAASSGGSGSSGGSVSSGKLNDLSDVTISETLDSGHVLIANGPTTFNNRSLVLTDLSDVTISDTLDSGHVLTVGVGGVYSFTALPAVSTFLSPTAAAEAIGHNVKDYFLVASNATGTDVEWRKSPYVILQALVERIENLEAEHTT